MKREIILFYLENNKVFIKLTKSNKEIEERVDTSLFFKYGEIYDVKKLRTFIEDIINEKNIISGLLKPDVYVLYNDICNSDIKYLYQAGLEPLNYNNIKFIKLSELIKNISKNKNIVFYDSNYYTIFKNKIKVNSIKDLDFEPIIIGNTNNENVHFSDEYVIWKYFKTHFTNLTMYDII